MATFIPNVTDVFPEVSDFDPDFNRIERMLKLRENAYQQGAKRIKSLYDSVFNSRMLKDDNIKTRDAYLKMVSESLNSLSATDLSLPQNQETAANLFNPILTDPNLQHDMLYTKKYFEEASNAEKLRFSSDAETRKRYSPVGIKAMQYQAEEFKNASRDEALTMSAPRYVPKIDIDGIVQKLTKEAKISVKEDRVNGGYIYTKKNGDIAVPISRAYVESMFANDPGITDWLRTQAYVARKDFINNNAAQLGGQDKAERFYLENIIKTGSQAAGQQININQLEVKKQQERVESWNKKISTDGIVPGSDDHMRYLADLEKLKTLEAGVSAKKNQVSAPADISFENLEEARQYVDNLVTFSNYSILAEQIAQKIAFTNTEFSVKADPISLAHLRANLSLRNSQIMESIRYANRLNILEKEVKAGKYSKSGKGGKTKDGKEKPDKESLLNGLFDEEANNVNSDIDADSLDNNTINTDSTSLADNEDNEEVLVGSNKGSGTNTSSEEPAISVTTPLFVK